MIDSLSTAETGHQQPTLADIEQRSHDPITQAGLRSQHQTVPASREPAPQPEHSDQAIFEQYALYGLAGEAVRALAPHTEASPKPFSCNCSPPLATSLAPDPTAWSAPPVTP